MRPPRTRRRSRGPRLSRSPALPGPSGPSSSMRPAVTQALAGSRPRMARAVSVLPEPDSPTRPKISPRSTVSERPRTTGCHLPATGKAMVSSCTARRDTAAQFLRRQPAEPGDQGGDAEARGAGRRSSRVGFDVGDTGDVEVGPAPHLAHELGEEGGGEAGAPPTARRVAQVGVGALHLLQVLREKRQPPQALALP